MGTGSLIGDVTRGPFVQKLPHGQKGGPSLHLRLNDVRVSGDWDAGSIDVETEGAHESRPKAKKQDMGTPRGSPGFT